MAKVRSLTRWAVVGLIVVLASVSGQGQRGPLTATKFPTTLVTGTLADTTVYTIAKPEAWNGTLFVDLDSGLNSEASNWLYEHGIARAGTTRAQIGSRTDHAADNLAETLDVFTKRFGKPTRAILAGASLGGQTGAIAAFKYGDRFAGAVLQCGGLMGWTPYFNPVLDVAFAVKALLAPQADLPLVNIPTDDAAIAARWKTVIDEAQKTPQGRARITLAVALGQAPFWSDRQKPEPAATDAAGRQEAAYTTLVDFSREFTALRRRFEEAAGGATSWNTGVNYPQLYDKISAVDRQTVEALYRQAGLSVTDDLRTIERAPRVAPQTKPLEYAWKMYPFDGKLSIPVMIMSNTGDPYVWTSIDSAYAALVRRAGREEMLRRAYVRAAGHCGFSQAETIASYQIILERLDTGRWPDVSPTAMNKRAEASNQGVARFFDYLPPTLQRAALQP